MPTIAFQESVTIVCISDIEISKSAAALSISIKKTKAKRAIVFTSRIKKWRESINLYIKDQSGIELKFIEVDPIDSLQSYSTLVEHNIGPKLHTSHCLIIQHDGFVLNANAWRDYMLTYDYVGAPFLPRIKDKNYSRDEEGRFWSIGNGGFSLRSKRLLLAAYHYQLSDNFQYTNGHEDGFFCVLHRYFLEQNGFVWADTVEAQCFSLEKLSVSTFISLLFNIQPFGLHGKIASYILTYYSIKKLFMR